MKNRRKVPRGLAEVFCAIVAEDNAAKRQVLAAEFHALREEYETEIANSAIKDTLTKLGLKKIQRNVLGRYSLPALLSMQEKLRTQIDTINRNRGRRTFEKSAQRLAAEKEARTAWDRDPGLKTLTLAADIKVSLKVHRDVQTIARWIRPYKPWKRDWTT